MPLVPFAIRTNEAAWRAYVEKPEYQAAQEKSHSFGAKLVDENQLLATEVQPGQYTFSVIVYELTNGAARPIAISGEVPINVPEGHASVPIDAGMIQLQPVQ